MPSLAVSALQKRLPKIISPRVHGVIDYAHAAFFFGVALACRKRNPRAALAAAGTGAFILGGALLTDYPLGARRVMPFATHGKLDAGFAGTSALMPRLFGFADTGAAAIFAANSIAEAAVVGLTDWDNERAHAEAEAA